MDAKFKKIRSGEIITLTCDSVRNTISEYILFGVGDHNGKKVIVRIPKTNWKRIKA